MDGLLGCRGELKGQTGIVVYAFRDAECASRFQRRRQVEAKPLMLEILDKIPNEVREYIP